MTLISIQAVQSRRPPWAGWQHCKGDVRFAQVILFCSEERVLSAIKSHRAVCNDAIRGRSQAHTRLAGDAAWARAGPPKSQMPPKVATNKHLLRHLSAHHLDLTVLANFAVCKTVSSDSQKLIAHQEKSSALRAPQRRPPFGRGRSDGGRVHVATRHGDWVKIGLLRRCYTGCLRPIPGAASWPRMCPWRGEDLCDYRFDSEWETDGEAGRRQAF
ncbi:hypothetical protein FB451DRAFT_1180233 [Mycena latifolia]|nr:hypothetical protein FB451DRAFT_1180233 [Mycena latifolia]